MPYDATTRLLYADRVFVKGDTAADTGAGRVSAEHVSALSNGYVTAEFFVNVSAAGEFGN